MRLTIKLKDGIVTIKPDTSETMINYIYFLISHHRYDAKKFESAKGTELFKYIENVEVF